MSDSGTNYQLLYYSSHPEDGERVCVGLVIGSHGLAHLEFDDSLGKLRSIAREQDIEYVRGVLHELSRNVSASEMKNVVAQMEPQFALSQERRLVLPPTSDTIEQLRQRFLMRWRPSVATRTYDSEIRVKIAQLIARSAPQSQSRFRTGARPSQVIGATLAQQFLIQRPVAQALVGRSSAVIFDGIDISASPVGALIARTNSIKFNFWQYRNAYQSGDLPVGAPTKVVKVGVVFDGSPASSTLVKYASHEFRQEADFTIISPASAVDPAIIAEIQSVVEDQSVTL